MIRVDGDECPDIKVIERVAQKYHVSMKVYVDTSHVLNCDYAIVVIVDTGMQSVDVKLENEIQQKDIVITQDYGVAVVALSKNAYVIHPSGVEYTNYNILELLENRHRNIKLRRQRIKTARIKKRTKSDTIYLKETLVRLIEKSDA